MSQIQMKTLLIVGLFIVSGKCLKKSCERRDYGKGSVVCVCSEYNCHILKRISKPTRGKAVVYETTQSGVRFQSQILQFSRIKKNTDLVIKPRVHTNKNNATAILGFGGAFTDATGINIASLTSTMQTMLLQAYFSPEGLDYNIGRIPMASCDFSTRIYTYDDTPDDFELKDFNLTHEDIELKIPFIKQAQRMQPIELLLFGSPWTAPPWMKTSNNILSGIIKEEPGGKYYRSWAEYFVKYLKAYEKHGVEHWGLTPQNEPNEGLMIDFKFQCTGFNGSMQRDFIKTDLGPTLKRSGYGHLNLMILDDNRLWLEEFAQAILSDPEAAQFVSGMATHWYADLGYAPTIIDSVRTQFPEYFILSTEACAGFLSTDIPHVSLGAWGRGEQYMHSIMENLQHSVAGWVDWNLALNTEGGPNWIKNFVDAPIIVNETANEFYLQPTYYAMAHFSKFITRGSHLIYSQNINKLEVVSFLRPDEGVVVVVLNLGDEENAFQIEDQRVGYLTNIVQPHSIQTILYYP